MLRVVLPKLKLSFVVMVIASLISLAIYSSLTGPQNGLTQVVNLALNLTEEEEERTVREVPEVLFHIDHVATAQLNQKRKAFTFPTHLNLSPQGYFSFLKKPPRLS